VPAAPIHDFLEVPPHKARTTATAGPGTICPEAAWCGFATPHEETPMTWHTPAYCEIRLGFEVTAYVYVR